LGIHVLVWLTSLKWRHLAEALLFRREIRASECRLLQEARVVVCILISLQNIVHVLPAYRGTKPKFGKYVVNKHIGSYNSVIESLKLY